MKSKELRIGNWVMRNDIPVQIVWNNLGFEISPDNPIDLTDELLIKSGFVRNNSIFENGLHLSPIYLMKEDRGYYMRQSTGYINKHPIKWVHQLQNLYFVLTEIELQVNF